MSRQQELFSALLPEGFEHRRSFLASDEAERLMEKLLSCVEWAEGEIVFSGKVSNIPRLTAWYGDEGATYVYSGIRNEPLPWTQEIAQLRDLVSKEAWVRFNSVLLNRYRDGADSVAWHSDDEPELGPTPTIASLSLGATRRFRLRHKETRETLGIELEAGSLLLMSGESQRHWDHCLTKTKCKIDERINLTFRVVTVGRSL